MRRRMRAETEHTKANYWTKWAHTLVKAASISKKIDSSVFSKVHRKSFFRKHSDQSSQMTGHAQGSQIKSTRMKKGKRRMRTHKGWQTAEHRGEHKKAMNDFSKAHLEFKLTPGQVHWHPKRFIRDLQKKWRMVLQDLLFSQKLWEENGQIQKWRQLYSNWFNQQ